MGKNGITAKWNAKIWFEQFSAVVIGVARFGFYCWRSILTFLINDLLIIEKEEKLILVPILLELYYRINVHTFLTEVG